MSAPVYVVVCQHGGAYVDANDTLGGPIVMETDVGTASLERAQASAARFDADKRFGPCRIGRVVFEGEPGFEVQP